MFFVFSDHIWPAPLLAHTTLETVFPPNLCVENLGQWGCSSGQFVRISRCVWVCRFSTYAQQFLKCNGSERFLYWNQGIISCTCGHLLREKESSQNVHPNGNWMLSQSRTTSLERRDLMVLGTAKLRNRNSISWPTPRGRDVTKEIAKEFTIVLHEIL